MPMVLNKPNLPKETKDTLTAHEVAQFIAEGDKRPAKSRAVSRTYRLNQIFIDVMEADAKRIGLGNTDILKAALTAWNSLNENEKNHWVLESNKM